MNEDTLLHVFAAVAPTGAWPESATSALGAGVVAAVQRAVASCPEVAGQPEAFVRFFGERFPETDDPLTMIESLRVEEMALCFSALQGSQRALRELERTFVAAAGSALGRLGLSPHARDEAMQRAREKLLAGGPNAAPKLTQYAGQGSLGGWIRVVVVRTALNTQRAERRMAPRDDDVLATRIAHDAEDPEIEIIKGRYAQTLADAVSEAFRRLTSEQRNLLRMYVIDGLTLAELGRMHGVDASTISRWLARIRSKLLDEARNHLLEQYAMRASECESLMRVVRSGLHVTIERLLATESPDTVDG
jgi:RNA polymerase sigma-70 factor (ECF subfamily)